MNLPIAKPCLALTLLGVLVGCATTVPESDSTPPELTLHWRVTAPMPWAEGPGPGDDLTILSTPTTTAYFWALASDDEGVREVAIQASGWLRFVGGGMPVSQLLTLSAVNAADSDVGPGDEAFSRLNALLGIDESDWECPEGKVFESATITVRATAENFFGDAVESGEIIVTIE